MSDKNHWDQRYQERDMEQLGWYEKLSQPSIDLLNKSGIKKSDSILVVGAGSSLFIDYLVEQGFKNIIANDISEEALNHLEERIGPYGARYIEDDLTKPNRLTDIEAVDYWHDRAVLHFFTEAADQESYFKLLKSKVKVGGHVMLGEFSKDGAEKCAGLVLCRYDLGMMQDQLGEDFELVESFNTVYINPRGEDRPYIYGLFKRIK